jgi:hypothetical protein
MSLDGMTYLPLPDYKTESDLADDVLAALDPWFHYKREVRGTHCTGRRLRLDAVLWPRDPQDWKDATPVFGVEFKLAGTAGYRSTKDFTAWAAQAVNYTHVDWDDFGRLMIFACPSVMRHFQTPAIRHAAWDDPRWLMSRLLWQLGVGELALLKREGWTLLGQGDSVLWSQWKGARVARNWSIKPKVGSR